MALILLSLVIVAAAAFIVVRNVVPAFQGGILGGGEPKTAEGLTLDRTALDLAEAGTTMALVPTFSPEGATAQLTWTSSKPEVATVDEKGTVTAVAPEPRSSPPPWRMDRRRSVRSTALGPQMPPARSPPGQSPRPMERTPPRRQSPPLSANDITLDSEGTPSRLR